MTPAERAARLDDVQDLIDALRKDDTLPLPDQFESDGCIKFHFLRGYGDKAEMAQVAGVLPWGWDKRVREYGPGEEDSYLDLTARTKGGLRVVLTAFRASVCRIDGYEDREVEVTVTPAVKETVTRAMPVWKCESLLAGNDDGPVAP